MDSLQGTMQTGLSFVVGAHTHYGHCVSLGVHLTCRDVQRIQGSLCEITVEVNISVSFSFLLMDLVCWFN